MAADLSILGSQIDSEMEDLREEVLRSVEEDESFLNNYERIIVPNPRDTFRNAINISIDSIDTINTLLQNSLETVISYQMPEKPAILTSEIIREDGHVFDEDRLKETAAALRNVYSSIEQNSGYSFSNGSITEAIQEAMYSIGYDIQKEELKAEVNSMAYRWAADGYEQAPGSLSFEISEAVNKMNQDRTERTSDVFGSLAKIVQSNAQWAFENGVAIEKLHMDFAAEHSKLQFIAIENATKAYVAEIEKIKSEIKAPILNVASIVKAARIDNTSSKAEQELKLKDAINNLNTYVSTYGARISGEAEYVGQKISVSENIAKAYAAIFDTYGSLFTGVAIEEQSVDEEGD